MHLAIIPARGGSKRIPRKNIKAFNGKPMIAWSIETALQAGIFDQIWVSTDDAEIAAVARAYGAEVPFIRPATLADDYTGTSAVIKHAIEYAQQQHRISLDTVTCIYATAPLLPPQILREAMHLLLADNKLDYVFSGCRFSFPIQRALYRNEDGIVQPVDPVSMPKRSQDLTETFHDAGQFYCAPVHSWLADKSVFSAHSFLYELPAHLVQDIDTAQDWRRAELLHQLLLQS